jgi:hypothetical protein
MLGLRYNQPSDQAYYIEDYQIFDDSIAKNLKIYNFEATYLPSNIFKRLQSVS